jgi:hypothetical protein
MAIRRAPKEIVGRPPWKVRRMIVKLTLIFCAVSVALPDGLRRRDRTQPHDRQRLLPALAGWNVVAVMRLKMSGLSLFDEPVCQQGVTN